MSNYNRNQRIQEQILLIDSEVLPRVRKQNKFKSLSSNQKAAI